MSRDNFGFDPSIVKLGVELALYQNDARDSRYLATVVITKVNAKSFKVEGYRAVEDELFKLDTGKSKDHGSHRYGGSWTYAVLPLDHPRVVELRWRAQVKSDHLVVFKALEALREQERTQEFPTPEVVEAAAKALLAHAALLRAKPQS